MSGQIPKEALREVKEITVSSLVNNAVFMCIILVILHLHANM